MEREIGRFELPAEFEPLIPLDKSWLIRLGVLDLLHDSFETTTFIDQHKHLGTDLLALSTASKQWRNGLPIHVGESGTLYRFLQFAAWHLGQDRTFIRRGTLKDRDIVLDPSIINLPLVELLKLDNGTSQWASAAVLLGNKETPPEPMPYKLQLTYDALEHWNTARAKFRSWEARQDITIASQAKAYLKWRETKEMDFEPQQAEDYCFARAFGIISPEEGEARWPSLRQHESDRIISMERALDQQIVDSSDHRVVQAIAMLKGHSVRYEHPEAVSKSWPLFWKFIELKT